MKVEFYRISPEHGVSPCSRPHPSTGTVQSDLAALCASDADGVHFCAMAYDAGNRPLHESVCCQEAT